MVKHYLNINVYHGQTDAPAFLKGRPFEHRWVNRGSMKSKVFRVHSPWDKIWKGNENWNSIVISTDQCNGFFFLDNDC